MTKRFSAKVIQAFESAGLPQTLAVNAATAESPAEILLYSEIGEWGITAKDFIGAMADAGAGPLRVRINSPGGDVFDGMAIYNALKAHPGGVTCVVDGLAASAASFIALAGDSLEMGSASSLMIHCAWSVAFGNKNDMRQTADVLDKIDGQIAAMYAAKTGADLADIAAAMVAETWMTADEAVSAGYADSVVATPAKGKSAKAQAAAAIEAPIEASAPVETPEDDGAAEAHARAVKIVDLRARIAMVAD